MSGPFSAGGVYQRNRTSWTLTPSQDIPAGAFIFLACGGNIDDTATVSITDSAGNTYALQVNSQQPGTVGTLFVFLVPNCKALTAAQSISITSSVRGDLLATLFYYTSVRGQLYSTNVAWNAGAQPSASVPAFKDQQLFSILAVAGPNNDGFTNDAAWGADLLPNVATVNATIHASGRSVPSDGTYSYSPTLGANRQSVLLVTSFW